MQHFPKNCFHFPESSVKFASSTKNEVRKFGEVRSSSSTEILICNPGIMWMHATGDRIFAGDLRESIHIFRYRKMENQLYVLADDQTPRS